MPSKPDASSSSAGGTKKRKTKLEKICELESSVKLLKEENRRLKKELHSAKSRTTSSSASSVVSSDSRKGLHDDANDGNEKLKEAVRALKRVAVKQELSLKTLREKARQRRKDIEHRDSILLKMKDEVKSLKVAYQKFTAGGNNDVEELRARVAELELKLATEDSKNDAQNKLLAESKQNITNLRDQLERMRGMPQRVPSSRSLKSSESGSSVEDVMKLKRDLARKMEQIATLQHDLEDARDEIHELKQKQTFDTAFPAAPAAADDDWFSDNEDDDFWG